MPGHTNRGQLQIVDLIIGLSLAVAIIVIAPFIYTFIGMITESADPFTQLILQLTVPFLFIALIISMGVSARRGGF